jgi:hypothetical protein
MDQHKGVPRFALEHFVGPGGHVWTYDKETGHHWPSKPARTGVEADYYSVEREDGSMDPTPESFFSVLEGEAAPINNKMADGIMPRGSDRETFGHFLGVMFVRSPGMRRMAAEVHKRGLETHIAFTAQIQRRCIPSIAAMDSQTRRSRSRSLLAANDCLSFTGKSRRRSK